MKANEPAIWKQIPDWPQYEVSNDGQVRCWSIPGFKPKDRTRRLPRYKKAHVAKDGYARVTLCESSHTPKQRIETFSVHRLVAMCFIPTDNINLDVAHLDGLKTNNHYKNLKWCTRKENESHKVIHGTRASGTKNGQSKLCDRAVSAIRKLAKEKRWKQREIAELFQVGKANVSSIILGKSWRET